MFSCKTRLYNAYNRIACKSTEFLLIVQHLAAKITENRVFLSYFLCLYTHLA